MKRFHSQKRILPALALLAVAGTVCAEDRIVPEGELGQYWTVADGHGLSVAGYPASKVREAANACVAMAYRVEADGTTSLPVVLNAWDSKSGEKAKLDDAWDAFAQSAATAVAAWRFKSVAGIEPLPTVTVSTFGFMADGTASKAAVRNHCRVNAEALAKADRQMSHSVAMRRNAFANWPPNTMASQRIHADNVSRSLQPPSVRTGR